MDVRWLGIPIFVWGVLCLALAIVFTIVWPSSRATNAAGLQYFLLRWGHALVWLLLAASCFLRGMSQPGVANVIALGAGLCYLAFLGSLITTRPA